MNCWQCRGHACDATTHVRDGRGQVGQAAAHFCARLNAFKRLTSLLCNSNKSAHMACPRRFESFMTSRCCASARRLPDAQGGECTGLRQPPVWRAGRRSPVPSANRPQSVRGGQNRTRLVAAQTWPRRFDLRRCPEPQSEKYIARAAVSDNTGAIKTAAAVPIVGWSQYDLTQDRQVNKMETVGSTP
jgi:hypothetical protein